MNNPKISIILPSLNVKEFIKECLESVIKQTLSEIEIICVDGGSTDGTLELLEEYSHIDSRIKLVHSDVRSYGYQMNLGINIAKGEYIGIVETDDYVDEKMYETLYELSNNGTVDICKSSFYHIQENEIFVDVSKQGLPTNEFNVFENPTILKSHPSIWAAIYRRSFLIENNICFMEAPGGGWVDNPFLFETFLSAKSIKYIEKPFYYYREFNPNSSSNNIHDLTLPMKRMLDIFDVLNKFNCNDRKILATYYIRIFWHAQDLINNHDLGNQQQDVLFYINKVLKKLDPSIVKDNFGLKEQKFYYEYSSPVPLMKLNKNSNFECTPKDIKQILLENEFLKSFNFDESHEISNNENLIEKRLNSTYSKLIKLDNKLKNVNIAYILIGFPVHSETFIVNEVQWLVENNYNVVVFMRNEPYKARPINFDVTTIKFNNIEDLEKLLISYEIDLMHTHFIFPICTNFTFPIAEKLKIPFTAFAHAFDIFIHENTKRNNIDKISQSKYCMGIFTLSNFHKNFLIEQGANKHKIIITKQATSYIPASLKIKPNKIKKIISISRFVEKKGLDDLIDAAKLLENEDFEFSIYGFGELENELQKKINDLNCSNISIKGELKPDDVIPKLKESDLLISPCKIAKNGDMDGFPTVIFEAMAAGIPVLTTDVSSIPEIITNRKNGFLTKSNNPKLLSEKIKEVSHLTPERLYGIRKQAQEDVINISSVEKTMNKYIDVIRQYRI